MRNGRNPFGARGTFDTGGGEAIIYRLERLERMGLTNLSRLPFSLRILLENLLRNASGSLVTEEDVTSLAAWRPGSAPGREIPFIPSRVLLQDFTGVPVVADLAAMRAAMSRLGGDPTRINPLVPVDLVIDHSVQVDAFGSEWAYQFNVRREFERNRERYAFLKWAQKAFRNFRVVPPGTGIVHQVNLEYLSPVVEIRTVDGEQAAVPDAIVGTDSHTTMVNGLGVLGWGVGGIEAEAAMLGQPYHMLIPEVIGVKLVGELPEGSTATDLVLTVTQLLRRRGVVEKFVEFFGPGLAHISVADRATIANMAPEYGATMGYFPVDDATLAYLRQTGRDPGRVRLVERYFKEQGLFRTDATPDPEYTATLTLDLASVEPSVAGPRRPQDRLALGQVRNSLRQLVKEAGKSDGGAAPSGGTAVRHGSVVIAAITSCTNTSNPSVMIGAGLLARNAVARGLAVPGHVKTSLAPGSRVVTDYLAAAGLMPALEALRFHVVGYGCTTCIGNSGKLPDDVARAVEANDLVVAAVLSGNRNFEGRVNPLVKANYLASPMLVVAYALAGTVDCDLVRDPLGTDKDGKPVYLREIWPTAREIEATVAKAVGPDMFRSRYARVFDGDENWQALEVPSGDLYVWDPRSTYLQEPPFLRDIPLHPAPVADIRGARVLVAVGDSITTDHISPAGAIPLRSPAADYLRARGVGPDDFNTYGARRGNHEVMMRGTFGNIRLRNALAGGREGGWTAHQPDGELQPVYDAAMRYIEEGTPLLVLAGKDYGMGSSRDWAAKGTLLLGVKAVIAEGFERIHRSNLIGMGVLPLQFKPGDSWKSLGLTGAETFDIGGLSGNLAPRQQAEVVARRPEGGEVRFPVTVRLDSAVEVEYYRHGGILPAVLRRIVRGGTA